MTPLFAKPFTATYPITTSASRLPYSYIFRDTSLVILHSQGGICANGWEKTRKHLPLSFSSTLSLSRIIDKNSKNSRNPPAVLFIYVYLPFILGFQYTRTTSPQCGHFSSITITPKRFSQMSQTRFLHKLFEHLILRIPTTSSPKNAEAHIGISQ